MHFVNAIYLKSVKHFLVYDSMYLTKMYVRDEFVHYSLHPINHSKYRVSSQKADEYWDATKCAHFCFNVNINTLTNYLWCIKYVKYLLLFGVFICWVCVLFFHFFLLAFYFVSLFRAELMCVRLHLFL